MVSIGYFLSSEEYGPRELVRQARLAQDAGFERLWISDHYHPWNDEQGQSPFVWSVIGALSEVTTLPITTAVTCPTVRLHPAVVAQAAATAAVQCEGGFVLGVGSGEALNEHIFGDPWPSAPRRLSMLEEAVEVIRKLHTGEVVEHRGEHYTVENARVYTLPEQPVPIYVSAFGPKAATLAGRIGDGLCSTIPDASLVRKFHETGGHGKPAQAGFKVCHAPTVEQAVRTAHRVWPNDQLPGELSQVLPTPRHFEQAATLVTEDMVAQALPVGPDPEPYARAVQEYADAGYDEVYVQQIGSGHEEFFEFWAREVAPQVRGGGR
ncbi:TIGR03557 family F420-dependent LLM class oxidoreductase [Saccharothrix algeriensis]|uniref:G6PDH family F420-dependent oxidoreductase n=1 Tax=Saccharothrix algeriensis TaxID=173560 RepID=A0A8T8HVU3_9PSEU|nr:TIGR03557 family F420-dependent LLM class oxidoreductase [Saccharothrix algeriensis]MBM7813888.1 G6PDH family F420-dependent oxidoreductase [Saccharothrix algeriensis]QTR02320.1 TIGR03557 family F420-dependent LLM class oxidoreductase [Saccharothrix algeriensis]